MGRLNKETGEFKPKPSVNSRTVFMQQRPQPLRSCAKGTDVYVRMGAGWSKGTVLSWSRRSICCYCPQLKKQVSVYDNRSIRLPGDPKF